MLNLQIVKKKFTKWGNLNYKVTQFGFIRKGWEILKGGAIIITQRGIYYKKRPVFYKVRLVLQIGATGITKWGS